MRKLLLTLSFIFAFSLTANAQTDVAQMLNKALAEVEASRAALIAKDNVIALQDKLIAQQAAVIEAQSRENEAKQKVIDVLTAIKCNERTIAFKPFGWSIIKHVKKECF